MVGGRLKWEPQKKPWKLAQKAGGLFFSHSHGRNVNGGVVRVGGLDRAKEVIWGKKNNRSSLGRGGGSKFGFSSWPAYMVKPNGGPGGNGSGCRGWKGVKKVCQTRRIWPLSRGFGPCKRFPQRKNFGVDPNWGGDKVCEKHVRGKTHHPVGHPLMTEGGETNCGKKRLPDKVVESEGVVGALSGGHGWRERRLGGGKPEILLSLLGCEWKLVQLQLRQ